MKEKKLESKITECHKNCQVFVAREKKLNLESTLKFSKIKNWIIVYIEWPLKNVSSN